MATYTGQTGSLSIDAVAVAEVTSFTIDHTVNTIEATAMGDVYREYKTGMNEWSGSADVLYDSASIYQTGWPGNFAGNGSGGPAPVALIAYPSGNTAGFPKVSGNIYITGFSVSSEMEGMVTASISFQGNGAMTIGDAP